MLPSAQVTSRIIASASISGNVTASTYLELMFPFPVSHRCALAYRIWDLKVHNPVGASNDVQSTDISLYCRDSTGAEAWITASSGALIGNTRSTLGGLTSYLSGNIDTLGYDATTVYMTVNATSGYGTAANLSIQTNQFEIPGATNPGYVALRGIRLAHSGGYVTNQAKGVVYLLPDPGVIVV